MTGIQRHIFTLFILLIQFMSDIFRSIPFLLSSISNLASGVCISAENRRINGCENAKEKKYEEKKNEIKSFIRLFDLQTEGTKDRKFFSQKIKFWKDESNNKRKKQQIVDSRVNLLCVTTHQTIQHWNPADQKSKRIGFQSSAGTKKWGKNEKDKC